jgi:hypothetical protein
METKGDVQSEEMTKFGGQIRAVLPSQAKGLWLGRSHLRKCLTTRCYPDTIGKLRVPGTRAGCDEIGATSTESRPAVSPPGGSKLSDHELGSERANAMPVKTITIPDTAKTR